MNNSTENHLASLLIRSTFTQDVGEHWDIQFHDVKIDVKGAKKLKRSDESVQFDYHWVELQNVNGRKGWLYGKADFFAFEIEHYYLFVPRKPLVKFVHRHVRDEFVTEMPVFKKYQRNGRNDVITLIPSWDLAYLSELMLPKKLEGDEKFKQIFKK